MRRSALPVSPRAHAAFAAVLFITILGFGCSDDSPIPGCDNCEGWNRIVPELGRQAVAHPTDPDFVVYSTITKTPGASDEQRTSDEDLWLLWRGSSNPAEWVRWQLTGDEIETAGDNFQARWSPSGNSIAFVHSTGIGTYEVWSLGVTLPPNDPPSASFDPRGVAGRVVTNGRDPAWIDESALLFVRDDKLFRVDGAFSGRGDGVETQLTFDPPNFVNAEPFVDRHPFVSTDGIALFSTVGREDVGELLVATFAVQEGSPPETTAIRALLGMRAAGAPLFVYPLVDRGDTLITSDDENDPYVRFRSLPIADDGEYLIGARRDEAFFPLTEETYCDSLITRSVTLSTGEVDTLRLYFEIARGTILATSGRSNTQITWERFDGRASGSLGLVSLPCDFVSQDCVLSYQVDAFGNVIPNSLEPYLVIGRTNLGDADSVQVTIAPGESTIAKLFCDADSCGCVLPEVRRASFPSAAQLDAATRSRGAGDSGGDLRAIDGGSAIWRIDLSDPAAPAFSAILSAEDPDETLQTPALSPPLAGGVRFLAYASNRTGSWGLYLQKLDANLAPMGDPVLIETPGTTDNYVCIRNIYHPSWVAGSSANNLKLLVTMTACPDNGFADLGFDDDPWSQGELNVWEVAVSLE